MPQLSIPDAPSAAYAGQIAEPGAPSYRTSKIAEGALSAGQPVQRGTNPQTQVAPYAAGDLVDPANFAGFVFLETSADGTIADGDGVTVIEAGVVALSFSEAVTAGERVALTLASGALTGVPEGTPSTAAIQVLPARISETISAAGVGRAEVFNMGAPAPAVEAGEYTPTLTDVANIDASALLGARFLRVGNQVTVYFSVMIDPTAAAATELGLSLPVASNLVAAADLIGLANSAETVGEPMIVTGDASNDRAKLAYTSVGTGVVTWDGSFSYQIL